MLQKWLSLLLAFALAAAPLQASTAQTTQLDNHSCCDHESPAVEHHHQGVQVDEPEKASTGCPHCRHAQCNDDCSNGTCQGLHLFPGVSLPYAPSTQYLAGRATIIPASALTSRSYPPPLRPPLDTHG